MSKCRVNKRDPLTHMDVMGKKAWKKGRGQHENQPNLANIFMHFICNSS